jgi:asparagine synthase (glutamine-hydrolysing)
MCGIAGIFGPSFDKPFPLVALNHRGPDAEGSWKDLNNNIWLGHRRLSIFDLSEKGNQPMKCVNGQYQIVFNGEIYNFLELKKELESKGYRFISDSDTEIIPAAYDCWGIDCLQRFNGMWAFAIWDAEKKELWLSRDRFGKKPLYYYKDRDDFAFASEVQALHHWLGPEAKLEHAVLSSICSGKFEWHGTEKTYLSDVQTVPGGYCLRVSRGSLRLQRWYRLEPNCVTVPKSLSDQAEVFKDLIIDACRLRLRSDVAIATCLSGGVDSSSVTAIVHQGIVTYDKRTAKDFHQAFCAAFTDTMLDETREAQELASVVGTKLEICDIKVPSEGRLLKAISSCDGPMHSLAFYPIWELYKLISERGIKVTLDGQGPDEMMGGYFETIQSALLSALQNFRLRWFKDIYKAYSRQGESRYRSSRGLAKRELLRLLKTPLSQLKRNLLSRVGDGSKSLDERLEFAQPIPSGLGSLSSELYSQFCQRQLPTILQQYDRCSMAHGVECRMPFMDYRIVDFLFSLPEESLIGGGYTKRVLREAMKGLVPDSTRLSRVKIGFNAPIVEWFLGPLRELILDTMRSAGFRQSDFFDGAKLAEKFEEWLKSPTWDRAWAFWPPVHFILWEDQIKASLFLPSYEKSRNNLEAERYF